MGGSRVLWFPQHSATRTGDDCNQLGTATARYRENAYQNREQHNDDAFAGGGKRGHGRFFCQEYLERHESPLSVPHRVTNAFIVHLSHVLWRQNRLACWHPHTVKNQGRKGSREVNAYPISMNAIPGVHMVLRRICLFAVAILVTSPAWAQFTSNVQGVVQDSSGA